MESESTSRFPDALVLILAMIAGAQLLTYVLEPGSFERDGRRVIPGTFQQVAAEPLPWHAALTKIPSGMVAAAEIIFFVLIIGGSIEVVRRTGALDALIGAAINALGKRPLLLTGGMTTLFAIGSSTIGMAEEYLPFVPILVSMALALRMDAIVALGIVYVGCGTGYACAAFNPFTLMIAKDISGQSPAVGLGLRWGLLAIMLAIGIDHLMRYARRVQQDPAQSLVADVDYSGGYEIPVDTELTAVRIAVLAAFAAVIGVFVWGSTVHGWYLIELSALFLGLAIVAGILGRLGPNQIARAFLVGGEQLTGTALLIGFARTVEVVLVDARVIDTVIHGIASLLGRAEGLGAASPVLTAWGMLAVQSVCNLLVPSGSGQAFVTMPIMAPLADLTSVGRETAILAYQFGDGLANMIIPTNAVLMGMLLLGRIPYQRWARLVVPLLAKLYVVALLVLALAALARYE